MTLPEIIRYLLHSAEEKPQHYYWGLVGIADNYYHVGVEPKPHLVLVVSTSMWTGAKALGQFLADNVTLEREDVDKPVYFLVDGKVLTSVTEALLNQKEPFINPEAKLMSVLISVTKE